MSSTNNQSPINTTKFNSDLRTTKSIIIGAGQPIVVPVPPNKLTNEPKLNAVKSNLSVCANSTLSQVSSQTITSVRPTLQGEVSPSRPTPNDTKVISVEEFCPDGGTLDKGFLDDLPNVSNTDVRHTDYNYDSDSDSNDIGNPLVAKFHEDPFDDNIILKNSTLNEQTANTQTVLKPEPKVNPLAKNKSKNFNAPDLSLILTTKRRNSNSSDDFEIPNILDNKLNETSSDIHIQSNEEFDSWLSDTNQRRSPEGGEDEASLPSIDKTVKNSASSQSVDATKITRLQPTDNNDDEQECGEMKENTTKSKKKKKDKKEKKEKKEKSDKEKKRTKSKKSTADDLLSECKEPSLIRPDADDDQYEAL